VSVLQNSVLAVSWKLGSSLQ